VTGKSEIQWTDATWNPTSGCDRVSPGCDRCYAMTLAKRLKAMGSPRYQADGDPRTSGPGFGVAVHPDALDWPLRKTKPQRIFVNSMSDLFHESVPDEFIARVFAVMGLAEHHTFQLLTKRHGRMRSLLNSGAFRHAWFAARDERASRPDIQRAADRDEISLRVEWPLPNLWLGVSAEDQKWFGIRWAALEETPAAVRFISAEPLLGWIDMAFDHECGDPPHMYCPAVPDWVIVGGESGPGARPMELEWAREIVEQCRWSGIAPFVKQLGAVRGRELGIDSHGADWDGWPEDLRVREFPDDLAAVPS
jgi:protein gp37